MGSCGDPNADLSFREVEQRIDSVLNAFEPEVAGISVKTFTAEVANRILRSVRERRPRITTVVGGPHITLDGLKYVGENKIDFGIQGEGEDRLPALCECLKGDAKIGEMDGLLYWQDGALQRNPCGPNTIDLDSVGFPNYNSFTSVTANGGVIWEYPLLSSRGCPYHCSYCSMPAIMGGDWRYREASNVLDELKHARTKYGSKRFTVVDDNFTLKLSRVEALCDAIISEDLGMPWNSQNGIRADRINERIARKMKRAGCRYVWIGIESADAFVFNAINKGERLEDIRKGIRNLKSAGIGVGGFFILGLPYSTRESDLKSMDFVREQGIDGFWFNFVPYPHTEADAWVRAHGRLLRHCEGALQFGGNGMDPIFETAEYSGNERIQTFNEIHVSLGYYDRLIDPALPQWEQWRKTLDIVRQHGFERVVSLLFFILRHNARLLKNGIVSSFESLR